MTKEQLLQMAREAGFDISISQGLKNPTPEVFAANVLVTSEIERICQAAFKLGRNAVVDEVRRAIQESSSPFTAAEVHIKRLAISSIESLKDNTP